MHGCIDKGGEYVGVDKTQLGLCLQKITSFIPVSLLNGQISFSLPHRLLKIINEHKKLFQFCVKELLHGSSSTFKHKCFDLWVLKMGKFNNR